MLRLRSASAASLRGPWEAATSAAKKDLDRLTEGSLVGSPRKFGASVVADLASRATLRGLLAFGGAERPRSLCLSRLSDEIGVGGAAKYLLWETLASEEEETHAARHGFVGKPPVLGLISDGGSLRTVPQQTDACHHPTVEDQLVLRGVLRVRAFAHEYLQLAAFATHV